jgi:hypothetical protein
MRTYSLPGSPLRFNERWDSPTSAGVYHLPPACDVDWTQYQHTFEAHFATDGGGGGFEGLWSLTQKPFCVIRDTFLPRIQFLVMREN